MGWVSVIEDLQANVANLEGNLHRAKEDQALLKIKVNLKQLEEIVDLATDPEFKMAERYRYLEKANDIVVTRLERVEKSWHTYKRQPSEDRLERLLSTLDSVFRS